MRVYWNIEKVLLASVSLLLALALLASTLLWRPFGATLSFQQEAEERFLEVPQIVWGLNNQKIAIARAALTARYLNRTLIAPTLTSFIFINATDAIPFTHLFSVARFNDRCKGFTKITTARGEHATAVPIGSGRKWTPERDKQHLSALAREDTAVLRMVGRNPFLWPDHWPVKDYARVLECLTLTNSLQSTADRVVRSLRTSTGYAAVHMRVERDWQLHCRHLEDRAVRITKTRPHICVTKEEIVKRVATILPNRPAVVYLAAAAHPNLTQGWGQPVEKTDLDLPYIMQAAIDFEICKRADVFAGNSFSTFSSLVVMARTVEMMSCGTSFAYNVEGGPRPWVTNMSEPSLNTISFGSDQVSC